MPIFIFDPNILDDLEDRDDRRVAFIWLALQELQHKLEKLGSSLLTFYEPPLEVFKNLPEKYEIKTVFANHDYEPYAIERDLAIENLLKVSAISMHTFKDQVVFERDEILKNDGEPYTIFTPYSKRWLEKLSEFFLKSYPTSKFADNFLKHSSKAFPTLDEMGFRFPNPKSIDFPSKKLDLELIKEYNNQRDIPSITGTSHLGIHLRFGTLSIRELARITAPVNSTFLKELIWREFFQMILFHFPHVVSYSFKPAYDNIQWRNDEQEFGRWCSGTTGYPIVDAGMRELNNTGFMHNRIRMVTASFLTKHLLIDWRWGEAYFARKLLDYELASNNGGWQWAAGTGCDSAPYFRIFNPTLQTKKFDPAIEIYP